MSGRRAAENTNAGRGRFVWISEGLYEACRDAWQDSQPDAGTCEWAGDVAGAYESAPADPVEAISSKSALGFYLPKYLVAKAAVAVLAALGYPDV